MRKIAEEREIGKPKFRPFPSVWPGRYGFNTVIKPVWLTILLATIMVFLASQQTKMVQPILADQFEIGKPVVYFPIFFNANAREQLPIYGVNFISSAEDPADEVQYSNGLSTGATFNRWPIYWFNVEQENGIFDWQAQDLVVLADSAHGLQTNAILLGTPENYRTAGDDLDYHKRSSQRGMFSMQAVQAAAPIGLYEPVFDDGTDIAGAGKTINERNVWARFVHAAVNRYKPGGELTKIHHLAAEDGITHWEIWNEPDLSWFWDSPLVDYARLLKVGYLAAKQADPNANILFGGLANNVNYSTYYEDVLQIFASDPQGPAQNYYHDILATHSYFYAWQSWYHVYRARGVMNDFGLTKPIWLNETGVPAWDDYPGPVWDSKSDHRATLSEQADYTIQTAFYALFAGADAIFHFQLYDGCGNQPRGSDFPPHNGELCAHPDYPVCAGDANGLFTNPEDAACFTQHPSPESLRPNYEAFKVLTSILTDVEPLWRLRPGGPDPYNGPQEWIAFFQRSTGQRIIGMWSRVGSEQIANLEATSTFALKILPDGTTQVITPVDGFYSLTLPAATNQNAPWDPSLYAIGGQPTIIVENVS